MVKNKQTASIVVKVTTHRKDHDEITGIYVYRVRRRRQSFELVKDGKVVDRCEIGNKGAEMSSMESVVGSIARRHRKVLLAEFKTTRPA